MSGPGRRVAPGRGKPRIEIRDLKTRKLVQTILLRGRSAEKVLAGLYQRTDLDKYYLTMKCVERC